MADQSTDRMNPELKAKWLEALRGGTYTQAREKLRTDEGHCCLGVLCDVIDPSKWGKALDWDGWDSRLPLEINRSAGIPCEIEALLIKMNDEGSSFAEIADYIETHL